jgi:hypothetical protein
MPNMGARKADQGKGSRMKQPKRTYQDQWVKGALLDSDLRDIYKSALNKNDALLVLAGHLIEQVAKISTALSQLERV